MERLHLHTLKQLEKELSEARERSGNNSSHVNKTAVKEISHFVNGSGNQLEASSRGNNPDGDSNSRGLQNGDAEVVSSQTDNITTVQMTPQSLHGMPSYFPPGQMTGHLTARSDIYGFRVVLLEMLIGCRAMHKSRPSREHKLVEWTRPLLVQNKKLVRILDPRMEGQYSSKITIKVSSLANQCLSQNPKGRPVMSQVVETLESVQTHDLLRKEALFQSGSRSVTLFEAVDPRKKENEVKGDGENGAQKEIKI